MRKMPAQGLTVMQKLEAVGWAAKRAGRSYGEFSSTLTTEETEKIFSDYEKVLDARRLEDQTRTIGSRDAEKPGKTQKKNGAKKNTRNHTKEDSQ